MLKLPEHNTWIIITFAVCLSIILAAYMLSNSGRYVPMPGEGNSLTILDTKTGDIYTPTNGFGTKDRRIWVRRKLSNAKFKN